MSRVIRLRAPDTEALYELLAQDQCVNIFLKGFLDAINVERAWWYGVRADGQLRAAVLLLPGRLAVPWAPQAHDAIMLGQFVARATQAKYAGGTSRGV